MELSKLCLGTAQLGMNYGIKNATGKPSFEESQKIVDTAIKGGINAFDTAPAYGNSEEVLGKCLVGHDRSKLTIISKVHPVDWSKSKDEILNNLDMSIKKTLSDLGLKRIPVYLFHRFADIEKSGGLVLNELRKYQAKGVIGKLGISIYDPAEAEAALNIEGMEVMQVPFNLIDKRLLANGFLKKAKQKGITILARSVFLQGLFFKKDIPAGLKEFIPYQKEIIRISGDNDLSEEELALRYVLGIDDIDCAIIGAEITEQLAENIRHSKLPKLPANILKDIEKLGTAPEKVINPSLWGGLR